MKSDTLSTWVMVSIGLHILVGALHLLAQLARRFPEKKWAAVLCRWRFGPRTDVAHMTRAEKLQSATVALTWTFLLLLTAIGIARLVGTAPPKETPHPLLLVALFGFVFLGLIFLFTAARLLLHALVGKDRPKKWG